jgi:ankyrin repeat protein
MCIYLLVGVVYECSLSSCFIIDSIEGGGNMKKIYMLLLVLLLASWQSVAADDLNAELAVAAERGDVEKVKALIVSGADVNSRKGEHTPLMYAVYYSHYEVAKILIEAGADVNATHSTDHTVLYHALESRQLHAEVIQLLADAGVKMDYTPLNWAIRYRVVPEIVTILIEAGADVNEQNEFGSTVLIVAACRGRIQLIDILLRSGAEINASVEGSGVTALSCAVGQGHTEIAKLLIEAGADLETIDKWGNTPLMTAQSKGFEEIAKVLTDAGATR